MLAACVAVALVASSLASLAAPAPALGRPVAAEAAVQPAEPLESFHRFGASGGDVAEGGIKFVAGIAVSDASGHPLACEDMLKELRGAIDGGKIEVANQTVAQDFLAKAVERCNADDDAHANEFSAQGLRLASHGQ